MTASPLPLFYVDANLKSTFPIVSRPKAHGIRKITSVIQPAYLDQTPFPFTKTGHRWRVCNNGFTQLIHSRWQSEAIRDRRPVRQVSINVARVRRYAHLTPELTTRTCGRATLSTSTAWASCGRLARSGLIFRSAGLPASALMEALIGLCARVAIVHICWEPLATFWKKRLQTCKRPIPA